MKRSIIIYASIIVCLFATLLISCTDMLDLKPINEISDAAYWKSPADFKLAANEFYTYLYNWGGPTSDQQSDFVTGSTRNTVSNGTYLVSQGDANGTAWSSSYSRIRTINYLLDKAQTYSKPDEIKKYVAEAKFFRAFTYFTLLRQFGGSVIIDHLLTIDSPELYATQNTRDQVADFIISDLAAAARDLPAQSANVAADKGRITKDAADAFLSRVALFEGTWQKFRGNTARGNALLDTCIASSNRVITRGSFSLYKPAVLGDSALKYLFILEDEKSNPAGLNKSSNNEFIIANRYSYTLRQIRSNITHAYVKNVQWPLKKFVDMYLCTDGLPIEISPLFQGYANQTSEFLNRDHRLRYTLLKMNQYYWDNDNGRVNWTGDAAELAGSTGKMNPRLGSGYQNQKFGIERKLPDNEEGQDYGVLRYAELLLNYAEGVFERNGSISDADLDKSINLVRKRVNTAMPSLSNAFVTTNVLDMRTEIRRERNIELFLEGFRFDDLKRWKTAEVEMPMPLLGIKWQGTAWLAYWASPGFPADPTTGCLLIEAASARTFNPNKHYLFPIPTDQIARSNNNLVQNPGW